VGVTIVKIRHLASKEFDVGPTKSNSLHVNDDVAIRRVRSGYIEYFARERLR
jgi:hypothetical protein